MIVIRNVFRLKFGKAREAVALMKEGSHCAGDVGLSVRRLYDVTGPFYAGPELTVPISRRLKRRSALFSESGRRYQKMTPP